MEVTDSAWGLEKWRIEAESVSFTREALLMHPHFVDEQSVVEWLQSVAD